MLIDPGTLWRSDVALEISVHQAAGATRIDLTGMLAGSTLTNLARVVEDLLDGGERLFDIGVEGLRISEPDGHLGLQLVQHSVARAGGHVAWYGEPTHVGLVPADPGDPLGTVILR